ncbi:hypothetical protein M1B72_14830 [Geomonas paludis]|uniref:Uncharacterized protein n=1 Tax=Geomonas paludis TaxID=2740185 RepID=A0ABY4LE32_9BACT|nr:hypothetical protein [Geomonas paludis]UPU34717.1 hypothetical protein M1B72_14830 [Geomonas paludis]
MYRSLFVLLPLLIALMAGPAVAAESAATTEANTPLWHQTTKDAAPSPDVKTEAKPEAAPEAKPEAKPDTAPGSREEGKQDPVPVGRQESAPEAGQDARPEAGKQAQPAQQPGKTAAKEIEYGTQEQYRACMYSEDHIKDLRKMLEEHIIQNNEMMVEIKKQAAALLDMQRKLVMSDDAQVEDFNRRTREHNLVVKAANEATDKLKLELESFNNRSMEHNQNCASLIVKMSDRDVVMKERAPAPKQ